MPAAVKNAACDGLTSVGAVQKRYPVQRTDKLELVYLDGCALTQVWNDEGSKKDQDLSFWMPSSMVLQAFPGFSYPGEMPVVADGKSGYKLDPPQRYATFLVKPVAGSERLIVRPADYSFIWSDNKSGAKLDVQIHEPNCPSGYVPLGLHARPGHPTSTDNVRLNSAVACFDRSLTFQMEPLTEPRYRQPSNALWSTKDNDAANIGIFGVQRSAAQRSDAPNTILIPPPTFWAQRDKYEPPAVTKFRGLRLPIEPVKLQAKAAAGPRLSGPTIDDSDSVNPPTTGGYPISAFLVTDDYYDSALAKLLDSPVYWVQRTTRWRPLDDGRFCRSGSVSECEYSHAATTSESESDTWNNTVGGSVSVTVTADAEFKPLGLGTGLEVSLGIEASYSHDEGGETTRGTETSRGLNDTLTPPVFAAYFQAESSFRVYRHGDQNQSVENLVREYKSKGGPIDIATVKLEDEEGTDAGAGSCTDPGPNRDLEECGFPTTTLHQLDVGTPIYSAANDDNEGYYLFRGRSGTLEVREADAGLTQDAHVWSLDKISDHGRLGHPITNVSFADGQLVVRATGLPDWKSSPQTFPGAALEIDPEGNLRIVRPKGKRIQTLWNSKSEPEKAA